MGQYRENMSASRIFARRHMADLADVLIELTKEDGAVGIKAAKTLIERVEGAADRREEHVAEDARLDEILSAVAASLKES